MLAAESRIDFDVMRFNYQLPPPIRPSKSIEMEITRVMAAQEKYQKREVSRIS